MLRYFPTFNGIWGPLSAFCKAPVWPYMLNMPKSVSETSQSSIFDMDAPITIMCTNS